MQIFQLLCSTHKEFCKKRLHSLRQKSPSFLSTTALTLVNLINHSFTINFNILVLLLASSDLPWNSQYIFLSYNFFICKKIKTLCDLQSALSYTAATLHKTTKHLKCGSSNNFLN